LARPHQEVQVTGRENRAREKGTGYVIPENVKHRRGEPVILTYEDGSRSLGTIEWGDFGMADVSVYCEVGGRVILDKSGNGWPKLHTDRGGVRPVWARSK
jgi:hypothetical protein